MSGITLKKANYRTSVSKEEIAAAVKEAYSSNQSTGAIKDSKVIIVKKEASSKSGNASAVKTKSASAHK
jgi:hypothetical protein